MPPERFDDVIYFDPAYTARPMALNMLEYDEKFPEQKLLSLMNFLAFLESFMAMFPNQWVPLLNNILETRSFGYG